MTYKMPLANMSRFLNLLCLLGLYNNSCAQKAGDDSLRSFVQTKADAAILKEKVPGILVLYGKGKEENLYTTGFADPDKKLVFDKNTFFEIGSITKTFTAYVLMSVLRDHAIEDSSSIISFLPKEVQQNKFLDSTNFLQLMNHTSGLPRLPENMELKENDLQPYQHYNSKKLFDYLATVKPGATGKYQYSNLAAGLAGVLAERISGKTYAALLDQYIFLPFKIVDQNNTLEKSANKSQGYIDKEIKAEYWNMDVLAPAGALKCTGAEMIKYLQAMIEPIDSRSGVIIDSLTTTTLRLSPNTAVGRGWHSISMKGRPTVYWHNGGTYGFSTYAAFTKHTGHWVMVVTNHFNKNNSVSDILGNQVMNKMLEGWMKN
jgi:D-alanyl-D-alanine-carboxypeptidase/D-alanyl-D-alanine-endopeptidase